MDSQYEPTREDLRKLAYATGQLVAHAGDFYDLAYYLSAGYRDAVLTGEIDQALDPVYTGTSQIDPGPFVASEPNFSAAQEQPALTSAERYRWILAALNELQSVSNHTIADIARQARGDGVTWSAIGAALDVTKQVAHQRYGRASNMEYDTPPAV